MSAPKGNDYWTRRVVSGRNSLFAGPTFLWEASCEYFNWAHANPIQVPVAVTTRGGTTNLTLRRPRPMTIRGLCLFLGISRSTWFVYRRRQDFLDVCSAVENVMWVRNFEAAVAGLMNPAVIARQLGKYAPAPSQQTALLAA